MFSSSVRLPFYFSALGIHRSRTFPASYEHLIDLSLFWNFTPVHMYNEIKTKQTQQMMAKKPVQQFQRKSHLIVSHVKISCTCWATDKSLFVRLDNRLYGFWKIEIDPIFSFRKILIRISESPFFHRHHAGALFICPPRCCYVHTHTEGVTNRKKNISLFNFTLR
jgi:hypothetical protein